MYSADTFALSEIDSVFKLFSIFQNNLKFEIEAPGLLR